MAIGDRVGELVAAGIAARRRVDDVGTGDRGRAVSRCRDARDSQRIAIDMGQDPVCSLAPANYTEQYVIQNGGLDIHYLERRLGLK